MWRKSKAFRVLTYSLIAGVVIFVSLFARVVIRRAQDIKQQAIHVVQALIESRSPQPNVANVSEMALRDVREFRSATLGKARKIDVSEPSFGGDANGNRMIKITATCTSDGIPPLRLHLESSTADTSALVWEVDQLSSR